MQKAVTGQVMKSLEDFPDSSTDEELRLYQELFSTLDRLNQPQGFSVQQGKAALKLLLDCPETSEMLHRLAERSRKLEALLSRASQ